MPNQPSVITLELYGSCLELEGSALLDFNFSTTVVQWGDQNITHIINELACGTILDIQGKIGLSAQIKDELQTIVEAHKKQLLRAIYLDILDGKDIGTIDLNYLASKKSYIVLTDSTQVLGHTLENPNSTHQERVTAIQEIVDQTDQTSIIWPIVKKALKTIALIGLPTLAFALIGGASGGLTSLLTGPVAPATFWAGASVGSLIGIGFGFMKGIQLYRKYGTNLTTKNLLQVTSQEVLDDTEAKLEKFNNNTLLKPR